MDDPLATPPQIEHSPTPERHSVRTHTWKWHLRRMAIIIGGAIVIGGLGFEAYRVFFKKSKQLTPPVAVQQSPATQLAALPKDVPDATVKGYTNQYLSLSLEYPSNWKASETADQGIRIESPQFSFVSNEEGTVAGVFRVYIRRGARTSDSTYIGRGYALEPSERLAYTQPGSDQRKETLLTKYGLDEPTNFAYFFIAGNYELSKGQTLGPNYGKEAETYIIAGGYTSSKKTDDLDFYSVAPDMPTTSNAYKQAVAIIRSLKL